MKIYGLPRFARAPRLSGNEVFQRHFEHHLALLIHTVDFEDVLCHIQPDSSNLHDTLPLCDW
jgi:hypothetical protein